MLQCEFHLKETIFPKFGFSLLQIFRSSIIVTKFNLKRTVFTHFGIFILGFCISCGYPLILILCELAILVVEDL